MVSHDRNFDDIAHKFATNIYGSEKGDIRQVILWQDLCDILTHFSPSTLNILDAGGGLAQMSQKLAKLGHNVRLCDVSQEMLALAKKDIHTNGLDEHYQFLHAPVQSLAKMELPKSDLVLFHAVMEWLADPESALKSLLSEVKSGGIASVMFYNHHGLVYKNVVCGNLPHVLKGMPHRKRFKLQPQRGLVPESVYEWIESQGFSILGKSGIRCFSDYIGDRKYLGDYTDEDVLELEQKLCRQEPYLSMGRYIHVWAKKQ
jgi:S-adenosylmethionine-dependent methyltransferase